MIRPSSMIFLIVICMIGGVASSYAAPVLEPYVFTEEFEDGTVGAWSSYPPAQDTAYDPTIWVKPLRAVDADNRALYREITPNYNIDYMFGVRKKVGMYIDSSSELSFRAYIKSNRDIRGVKVRLGFDDGGSVETEIRFSSRETWRDCTLPLAEYVPDGAIRMLDAVAFMADCPDADPENLLRFGLDSVTINGLRESRWEFTAPENHVLEEWADAIAGVHFEEGGEIVIQGNPPFSAGSAAVTVSRALTGGDERHFRMRFSRDDGFWSVKIPLTERSGVTAGIWRATVSASSREKKNEMISTGLVFLVRTKDAPASNPRIFMNPGDAETIRAKASEGRMKAVWEGMTKRADSYRSRYDYNDFNYNLDAYDEVHWLPTYGGYITAIGVPSTYIRANGTVYGVSGDQEAGDAARHALLKMAAWPSFVHPHILNQGQFTYWPVGQKLTDMAIGYDMVADRFTAEERKTVAEALYSKGVTEIFREYVDDNRVSSNTSNWIGDVTSGGILCALAVMNEFEDRDLEPYMTGMILKLDALIKGCFDRDGGYGEGFSYLNHAMHCVNIAMPALKKMYAIQFPERVYNCLDSFLYQYDPETQKIYDYGDTSTGIGSLTNFTHVITETKNPYYKWLYDRRPGTSDVDLFYMDDSIQAKSPESLPNVRLFRDVGTAMFRSGFGHDDFAFIFRCGPFFNHQHFDQGSFYLLDRGTPFLSEVGRSNYYDDPWYQKLVIQAGGHNCILANRNPESQMAGDISHDVPAWDTGAGITDFVPFDGGGFVSGRLDPIYKGAFENLRRSVLYVEPRTVVLIDEAVAAPGTDTVDLRFHVPYRDAASVSGRDAVVEGENADLVIRTVCPAKYDADTVKRPMTLYEFRDENAITMKARGFVRLSAETAGDKRATTFVNVMSTDGEVMADLDETVNDTFTTMTVRGTTFAVKTDADGEPGASYTTAGVTTDALVYADTATGYIAMRATVLEKNGTDLFKASTPVSLAFRDGGVMSLTYSADEAVTMTFNLSSKPKLVTLDGEKIRDWDYDSKNGLTLELPEGTGTIGIR